MARVKFHTLTEQMFYTLLCLKDECYGMDIMDRVPRMTADRVKIGSGTLYNLLEQFEEAGMIRLTKAEGRRRSYILTEKGLQTANEDIDYGECIYPCDFDGNGKADYWFVQDNVDRLGQLYLADGEE